MKMHYYNCKLRLHGSVVNEVLKENLSAPEIIILRRLHGDDAVVEVKYAYTGNIDAIMERRRLHDRYGEGLKNHDEKLSVVRLFGEEYQPLLNAIKTVSIPEKLVKKSEMKAARLARNQSKASAQDNDVSKIDADDIEDEEDDIDGDEDEGLEEGETPPAKKEKEDKAPNKVTGATRRAAAAKPADAVI